MKCTAHALTGTYVGRETEGVRKFTGIRYARCELYCAPTAIPASDVTIDATHPSPFCPQNPNLVEQFALGRPFELKPQFNDALFLNVTVPANATGPLPVMVWVHGGAFKSGGASSPLTDTTRLTREGNVVTVALNYRLGFHGFVRDAEGNLANLGLLDIIEALRWVNGNIAAFGGDPTNVTIFGQSAGAAAVQYLLATDAAGALFTRAILQSSCFGSLTNREGVDAFQLKLANDLPDDASMEDIVKTEAFAMANNPEKGNAKYCAFAPRPGYAPLPARKDLPQAWSNAAGKVEILIGCGLRETSLYAGADPKLNFLLRFPLTHSIIEGVLAKKSREIFSEGARDFANAYANTGGAVHFYDFSWGVGESPWGGCHCSDVPLILEVDGPKDSPIFMGKSPDEIERASVGLRAIWATFAREGTIATYSIPGCIDIRKVAAGEREASWPA